MTCRSGVCQLHFCSDSSRCAALLALFCYIHVRIFSCDFLILSGLVFIRKSMVSKNRRGFTRRSIVWKSSDSQMHGRKMPILDHEIPRLLIEVAVIMSRAKQFRPTSTGRSNHTRDGPHRRLQQKRFDFSHDHFEPAAFGLLFVWHLFVLSKRIVVTSYRYVQVLFSWVEHRFVSDVQHCAQE